jgi:Proteasome-substrate-size regulator, N-terminal
MAEKGDDLAVVNPSPTSFHPTVSKPGTIIQVPVSAAVEAPSPAEMIVEENKPALKEGYNYWNHLPYEVEDDAARLEYLDSLIADLYTYLHAGDFSGGARRTTRLIKKWLSLKFKLPKETRKTLAKLYYELTLTPGIEPTAADSFASMFASLASYPSLPCVLS